MFTGEGPDWNDNMHGMRMPGMPPGMPNMMRGPRGPHLRGPHMGGPRGRFKASLFVTRFHTNVLEYS